MRSAVSLGNLPTTTHLIRGNTMSFNLSTKIDFAQFVAADAGNHEAQFEQRMAAVFTVYFNAYAHGQKTQFQLVQSACENHKDLKALYKAIPKGDTAARKAAKQAYQVYSGYAAALADASEAFPAPAKQKNLSTAECTALAEEVAARFVQVLTAHLSSFEKAAPTEEEKAQAQAKKAKDAKAKAKAEKEAREQEINDAVAKRIGALQPLTLADMVQAVADAARAGILTADQCAMLDAALDTHAIIDVEVTEVETITAQPVALAA